jgi:hypothetical protein
MRDFSNWKTCLSVAVIGAALFPATASATLVPLPAVDNPTTKVVTIGVAIPAANPLRPPSGGCGVQRIGAHPRGCVEPK